MKAKVSEDSLRSFVTSGLAGILSIITGVIIARTLGPSGKGIFSGAQLFYSSIIAITAGYSSAMTYFLTNRKLTLTALMPALTRLFWLACFLVWAALIGWSLVKGFSAFWIIYAIAVIPSVILSFQTGLFISFDRIRSLNYQNVGNALIKLLGVVLLAVILKRGITGALTAWLASLWVTAAVVIWFAAGVLRHEQPSENGIGFREVLSFSLKSCLGATLGFLNARIDSLLVILLAGAASFGVYSMATGVAELIFMISGAVETSISRLMGASAFETAAVITAKAIRVNTLIVGTLSAVLFAIAPALIEHVYGKPFDPAAAPLRILLPGLVVFSATRIFNSFFVYQLGRPIFTVYLMAAVILLQAAGCWIFIPTLGLSGAAAASVLAYFIAIVGQTWYFCRVTGFSPRLLWLPQPADFVRIAHAVKLAASRPRA